MSSAISASKSQMIRRPGPPPSRPQLFRRGRGSGISALPGPFSKRTTAWTSTTCFSSRPALRPLPRDPRKVRQPLPLPAGSTSPGHERRAVQAGKADSEPARQHLRGRRPGPVDLLMRPRRHPQHPQLRKGLPKAKVIYLEQNYRSTQTILESAHNVIAANQQRQGEEPLDRQRAGRPHHHVGGLKRAGRGPDRRQRRSNA